LLLSVQLLLWWWCLCDVLHLEKIIFETRSDLGDVSLHAAIDTTHVSHHTHLSNLALQISVESVDWSLWLRKERGKRELTWVIFFFFYLCLLYVEVGTL